MSIRSHSFRLAVLALLAAAQLHAIAHAAEHGVGEHEHEGVQCVYGTANDDDFDGVPPSGMAAAILVERAGTVVVCRYYNSLASDSVLPPATGPPSFS